MSSDAPQTLASRLQHFLNWLVRLRGSPEAIARGVSVGTLVAFTPTLGLQMLLAVGLATLVNANRPVAVVPTWLTNPLTSPPVYWFTYYVGSFVWPGTDHARVAAALRNALLEIESLDFLALREQLGVFLELGVDVFVAMWIGGLIVGGVAAAIAYPITLRTVVSLRVRRARRKGTKRPRRRRRKHSS